MPDIAKFQLGPLVVGMQGNHPVVDWANDAFEFVRADGESDISFQFSDTPPAENKDVIQYHLPRFDLAVRKTNSLQVDIYRRDRRSLLMRSLSAPAKSWRTWLAHGGSLDLGVIKDFAYKTSPFLFQCAMLNAGGSLAHAASMAVDDKALLLVAGSRVGKTSVLLPAVLFGKAKFLSDDHAIVDKDGNVYLHPMPMHIYGHSLKNNPQLRRFDSWQWRTGRKLDAKHAVRWIPPADIFGPDKLARKARLNEVIVMIRGTDDQFAYRKAESTETAGLCGTMITEELHEFVDRLSIAPGKILPSATTARDEIQRVFESAFTGRQCGVATIPPKAASDDIVRFLRQHSPTLESAFA
jgi:hypothetical protein